MAKGRLKRGVFITFEGVEGCGKSTHSRRVYRYIRDSLKLACLYTKEPGGTKAGEEIRRLLLHTDNTRLGDLAELFLFEASRTQLVDEVIKPALGRKKIVICDRFYDATMAYQGYGGNINRRLIARLNHIATEGLKPDLTIILDIDTKKGLHRATHRYGRDRMEKKRLSYHARVRKGYVNIARKNMWRVKLIPTKDSISETQGLIRREVLNVISRYKTSG